MSYREQENLTCLLIVSAISTLYARMVSGDSTNMLLKEMADKQHVYKDRLATSCVCLGESLSEHDGLKPLHYHPSPIPHTSNLMTTPVGGKEVSSVVYSEVSGQKMIDLHNAGGTVTTHP